MSKSGKLLLLMIASGVFVTNSIQSQVKIERNLSSPLYSKFDPQSVPSVWLETSNQTENQLEMPLPGGINEELRKKLDLKKTQLYKSKIAGKRGILNDHKTPSSSIQPIIEMPVDGFAGSGTPNDNHVAVANDGTFIAVMNTTIRVHDDTGKLLKAWSLEWFPATQNKVDNLPTLTRIYDPRVIYDPYEDRFIVLYMHGTTDKTSFIVVGFSEKGNPLDPWNVYMIPGKPINDTVWSDYPIVSQTKEDLFFTVNLLANGSSWEEGFREAVIWQIRKSDGYSGDSLHKNFFHNIKFKGESIWSICPVQNGPMPDGIDNYFLSVRPYAESNDTVFMHRITNTQSSGLADYELKVLKSNIPYGFPPSALQPDTGLRYKLRTNDARVLSAVRTGNHIQYMQNSHNFATMQSHIMHGDIYRIDQDPEIEASIFKDEDLEFGYPAIALASTKNGEPSTLTTAVFSGINDFPGMGVFYRNRYGEYSDFVKIKTGESIISYGAIAPDEQRWGDYEGIQWKYNEPGVFYCVGSYGKNRQMYSFVARVNVNDSVAEQPVESIRMFPIPSDKGVLNIEFTSDRKEFLGIVLNRIDGSTQNIGHGEQIYFPTELGTHIYRLHTHNLPTGVYIVKVYRNVIPFANTESSGFDYNGQNLVEQRKVIIQ